MTGETLDQIWHTFSREEGTAHKRPLTEFSPTRTPAYGCNRCDHQDYIDAGYIRHYRNHPWYD